MEKKKKISICYPKVVFIVCKTYKGFEKQNVYIHTKCFLEIYLLITGRMNIYHSIKSSKRTVIFSRFLLTLKAPRKTASENVVCLCRLLNILADFSNLFLHTGKQCGP